MQAIFILGVFGVFYTALAVLIAMVSTSSMQLKAERVDQVEEYFNDVEVAVLDGYLSQNVDFSSVALNTASASGERLDASIADTPKRLDYMLGSYMSWRPDQILQDPWGTDYYYRAIVEDTIIFADAGGISVEAPVTAFMLVSAGPDRAFADYADRENVSTFPTTFDGIKRYSSPENDAYADNIVHVFTTMSAMNKSWNYAKSIHDKIVNVIADNYKSQYELFSPTITSNYYDVVDMFPAGAWLGNTTAPNKGGAVCGSSYMNAWKDPNCEVPGVAAGGMTGNLTEAAGFPVFNGDLKALGIDDEIQAGLETLTFVNKEVLPVVVDSVEGKGDEVTVSFVRDLTSDWDVIYSRTIKGKEIIGGF